MKLFTEQCNQTKREIDIVKGKLDEKSEEKKKQMKDELAGLDDDEGGVGDH